MPNLITGLVAGLIFGTFSVPSMLPLQMDDKKRALAAAFASRFAIGLVIPNLALPFAGWLVGALVGCVLSLSDAIVTRAYAPILVIGTAGGALIGAAVSYPW